MRSITLTDDEQALVTAGQSLEAIRAVRVRTGSSFHQARKVVVTVEAERLAARDGHRRPASEAARTGS